MTDAGIGGVRAAVHRIPTEAPESDGTCAWDSTTMLVAEVEGGGTSGIGYSYADASAALLIRGRLAELLRGVPLLNVEAAWRAMVADLRNAGGPGVGAHAVSAVDTALWDLKAKFLGVSLAALLGPADARRRGRAQLPGADRAEERPAGHASGRGAAGRQRVDAQPPRSARSIRAASSCGGLAASTTSASCGSSSVPNWLSSSSCGMKWPVRAASRRAIRPGDAWRYT